MAGNGNQKNPADSPGIDGATEGQSLVKNCTNRLSRGTRAAERAKQKPIAPTK